MNLDSEAKKSATVHTSHIHSQWLDAIYKTGKKLSPWEWDFVSRLADTINRGHSLSLLQESILERIYAEKTKL